MRRFLDRAWRIVCSEDDTLHPACGRSQHPTICSVCATTIAAVTQDIAALRFNTAIARLMELANPPTVASVRPRASVETFVLLLAPFAPHIAEELWHKLGHQGTLAYVAWPGFDPVLAQDEEQEYVVQVSGKVRHRFHAIAGLDPAAPLALAAAKADPHVVTLLEGKTIAREIAVPRQLVSFVVRG